MRWILIILAIPVMVFAWDFTQERNTIPVCFDSVACQVPWGTGYNYVHPTFCDLDGDDDYDLVFGSDWNRVTYFSNIGTQSLFNYDFITDTLVVFSFPPPTSQRTCHPAFCDIDNDGDDDLILGAYNRLYFYCNTGDSINYNFNLIEEYFQGIEYLPQQYPVFIDIDNDIDFDLFIGFGAPYATQGGRIALYLNEGTPDSVAMVLVTDYFMNIDLGYEAIPAFTDIDADGDYDMFLGDEDGNIHYFRNDGTPQLYDFTIVSQQYQGINVGRIASPAFCDIDGDGDYDLFVGERSWGQDDRRGDIDYYENIGRADSAVFELVTQNFLSIDVGLSSYPTFIDIDNDGLKDMFIGDGDGNINYFSNTGTISNPALSLTDERFQNIVANYQSKPEFGDLDGDGDNDMIVGRSAMFECAVDLYRNIGTPEEPRMVIQALNFLGIDYGWPAPRFADIDSDGDLDLFVSHGYNQATFWENVGTPHSYDFVLNTPDFLNTPYQGDYCRICFGDLDGDGDLDVIRGHQDSGPPNYVGSYLDFYRNNGTPYSPNMVLEQPHFLGITLIKYAGPYLEDIDNDGDLDLFVGDACGGVSFWRNNAISGVVNKPRFTPCGFALGQNYPNPFNAVTTIPLTLERSLPVRVVVYNQLGQRVETLFEGEMAKGEHRIMWDGAQYGSGVYFISLRDERGMRGGRKVLLVK